MTNLLEPTICDWCGFQYEGEFNTETELQHLSICTVYQTKPADEVRNGKEFLEYPGAPGLMVERVFARESTI